MTNKKKIVLRVTVILTAVLIVLTFASRTIYGMSLTVVHVAEPQFDTVPVTAKSSGILSSEFAINVLAEDDWVITEVFVGNGDPVKTGDTLFTINTRDFEVYERQLENRIKDMEIGEKAIELGILRLENTITAIPASSIRNSAATRRFLAELTAEFELMQMQLEQVQTQLKQISLELDSFSYPPGGEVSAKSDGVIFNLAVKTGDHTGAGEKLMSILPGGVPLTVTFQLDSRVGVDFKPDDPVSVSFYTMIEGQPAEQKHNSYVYSIRLSDDGNFWEYEAVIDEYEGLPLMGIKTDITVGHSGVIFGLVVPAAAVSEGRYGPRVFVLENRPGLFGEEFFVMEMNVTVQASNSFVAAIDLPGGMHYEMVTYTSHPIADGDIVRVEKR